MSFLENAYKKQGKETLHMIVLDPANINSNVAGRIAYTAEKAGTDAILVGGSTSVKQQKLDDIVKEIKYSVSLPVILFPGSAKGISKYADVIFFLQLINGGSLRYIQEPLKGVPVIQELVKHGLEVIPVGYIIVEPGMTAGKKSAANLIKRDRIDDAICYSLSAQYSGKKFIYLEAGSGAPEPVPKEMVSAVKNGFDYRKYFDHVPVLIVGGGIKKPKQAKELAEAGADVIVTGTIVEKSKNLKKDLESIINSIKNR